MATSPCCPTKIGIIYLITSNNPLLPCKFFFFLKLFLFFKMKAHANNVMYMHMAMEAVSDDMAALSGITSEFFVPITCFFKMGGVTLQIKVINSQVIISVR